MKHEFLSIVVNGENHGYLTHRRNKPTKAQRQRKRVKLAKLAAKRALEENPPLPAYEPEPNPPPPPPQEKDELVQQPPKELTLGEKIKLFRNSFCGNCLIHGVRESCFECFQKNNIEYKIPKKCRL